MRHYEFCVDLMDDDDDEDDGDDDNGTAGRFGAVSCDACTKVKFSTFIYSGKERRWCPREVCPHTFSRLRFPE